MVVSVFRLNRRPFLSRAFYLENPLEWFNNVEPYSFIRERGPHMFRRFYGRVYY